MILTVTLNPAIDRNVTTDRLVFEDRGYILSTSETAGGRGINAARVIHSFGGETLAIAPVGGKTGERLECFLKKLEFPVEVVPIENPVRTNLTLSDEQGLTIKLNEKGPELKAEELSQIEEVVAARLDGATWLMLCGSLPPGVPVRYYQRLIRLAQQRGVKVLLDTDGDALRYGTEASPTVVCPNQFEAENLLGTALITRSQWIDAVDRIRQMGPENVVLSLSSEGAVAAYDDSIVLATPPAVDAVCPIGAGDALAAAFTWALDKTGDFEDALRWGVAGGTASAMLPGISFASLDQTREIYQKVEVRKLG